MCHIYLHRWIQGSQNLMARKFCDESQQRSLETLEYNTVLFPMTIQNPSFEYKFKKKEKQQSKHISALT